jgi:hypothetical protein
MIQELMVALKNCAKKTLEKFNRQSVRFKNWQTFWIETFVKKGFCCCV